jgi:GTP-binding protein
VLLRLASSTAQPQQQRRAPGSKGAVKGGGGKGADLRKRLRNKKQRRLEAVPAVWPLHPALPTPPPFSAHDINRAHQALVQNKYRRELRVRDPDELDQDPAQFAELVVIGRSNVGKSSLLNAMWRQEGLAPCSKTPGRTQTFDLYTTPAVPELRVMDVPGYGFARAPRSVVFDWHAKLSAYLNDRGQELLGRVYVLLDARRGVTAKDREVLAVLAASTATYQLVLTKADTLTPTRLREVVAALQSEVGADPKYVGCYPALHLVSSAKDFGLKELRASFCAAALLIDAPLSQMELADSDDGGATLDEEGDSIFGLQKLSKADKGRLLPAVDPSEADGKKND